MPLRVTLRWSDENPATPFARRIERLAEVDRRALGLRFGQPCDPRHLVELHDVSRMLESFSDYASFLDCSVDDTAAFFLNLDSFSSLTFEAAPGDLLMLINPCHSQSRRTLSIAHEFGHLVLGHQPVTLGRLDGTLAHTRYSDKQEHEAYAYALALLLPYAPLLQLLAAGASEAAFADHCGVSTDALHMRLKLVGLWESRAGR